MKKLLVLSWALGLVLLHSASAQAASLLGQLELQLDEPGLAMLTDRILGTNLNLDSHGDLDRCLLTGCSTGSFVAPWDLTMDPTIGSDANQPGLSAALQNTGRTDFPSHGGTDAGSTWDVPIHSAPNMPDFGPAPNTDLPGPGDMGNAAMSQLVNGPLAML